MKRGDIILCVNDTIDSDKAKEILAYFKVWVVKDETYKIREVLSNDGIVTGLLLEGVNNPITYITLIGRCQEPAFGTFRFRKLKNSEMGHLFESDEIINSDLVTVSY